jgi:hypothetical protein
VAPGSESTAPSPAALRMRRSRGRRRQGEAIVSFEVGPAVAATIMALGWLPEADRGDKDALARALLELIERAIELRITPTPVAEEGKVCFLCELKASTIETLVYLGWLQADQRDELAAIVAAFRRFAGRSLDVARNAGLND